MSVRAWITTLAALVLAGAPASAATVAGVQKGTAQLTGPGTLTVTIDEVDPERSFLVLGTRHDSNRPPGSMIRGHLASGTTIELVEASDTAFTIDVVWAVVEYESGVTVQRGETGMKGATVDVTIDAVPSVAQAFVLWSKTSEAGGGTWGANDPMLAELTSTTNLRLRADEGVAAHVVAWQVVAFDDPADVLVQTGTTSMGGATLTRTVALPTPVDPAATILLVGYTTGDSGSDIGERLVRARLLDEDTIEIDRSIGGDTLDEIHWQAIELRDGTTVQHGTTSLATGEASTLVPITAVDPESAVAFATVQTVAGQSLGRSSYDGDDVVGVASFTIDVNAATIDVARNATMAPADVAWQVVQFGRATFADVGDETGFDVTTTATPDAASGIAWGDLDGDGDLDAVLAGSTARVMINDGGAFVPTLLGDVRGQIALLDLDDDGDLDLWSARDGGADLEGAYVNDGAGSFTSLGPIGLAGAQSNGAAMAADVDLDGWCDVVMLSGDANRIGHNQRSPSPALVAATDPIYGLADAGAGGPCASADVNDDGIPDVFHHRDGGRLFRSDGDGTFTEDGGGIAVGTAAGETGAAWGDYDNDGDLDLFVPDAAPGTPGTLWRNDGGTFTDMAAGAGIANDAAQRSACWGDYDNDGDLDLYICTQNGTANALYRNRGDGRFLEVSEGADVEGASHDATFVDYDGDGDLDLAITREGAPAALLRNDLDSDDYLLVRLVGLGDGGTSRPAIGVRVELYAADGTTLLQRRDVGGARGYGGQEVLRTHFGGVSPSGTYVVKARFLSGTRTVTVVPAATSTTIGATTIPQMLTIVEEPAAPTVLTGWTEVDPAP